MTTKTTCSIWLFLTTGMGTISSHISHTIFVAVLPCLVHFRITQGRIPRLLSTEQLGLGFISAEVIDVGRLAIILLHMFYVNFRSPFDKFFESVFRLIREPFKASESIETAEEKDGGQGKACRAAFNKATEK